MILAESQSNGKVPELRETFINSFREGAINSAVIFNKYGVVPSGPQALETSNASSLLYTYRSIYAQINRINNDI